MAFKLLLMVDGALVHLRDERGAMLALLLRPGEVRTLANGLGGIVVMAK